MTTQMRLRTTLQRLVALALSAGCSSSGSVGTGCGGKADLAGADAQSGEGAPVEAKGPGAWDATIAREGAGDTGTNDIGDAWLAHDAGARDTGENDHDDSAASAADSGGTCVGGYYEITPAMACAVEDDGGCDAICNAGGTTWAYCFGDSKYNTALEVVRADGGTGCPAYDASIGISCMCWAGRLTGGIAPPAPVEPRGDLGALFAARAYLEAASVFAFERLERELVAHGAPPRLTRDARRARRDEVRHTAMQSRIARRHGRRVPAPEVPAKGPARSLFAIALENAVEGCVRETYGALAGLVEAARLPEGRLRRAMRAIALDECRHAELAWEVDAWARARLSDDEKLHLDRAMQRAIDELRKTDPAVADVLAANVWTASLLLGPMNWTRASLRTKNSMTSVEAPGIEPS